MTPLELVLAGTALELAYFVFEVPTGVVADLYSRKLSMVMSAVLSGVAMCLIDAVPHVAAVLVGMAVWGFAWTFPSGAEDARLAAEVGPVLLGPPTNEPRRWDGRPGRPASPPPSRWHLS